MLQCVCQPQQIYLPIKQWSESFIRILKLSRLGVEAKTCTAKDLTSEAKDLSFKAKGLIPEANVGYRKNYKSEELELA